MAEALGQADRVALALRLLAVDPAGLGGLWLRARAAPLREALLAALPGLVSSPPQRLHPTIADDALFGGMDLAATLAAGRIVRSAGLLARPGLLVLTMAERCPQGLAARLGQALDQGRHGLIALDEGADPDEALPPALAERLGLFLNLDGLRQADVALPDPAGLAAARDRLAGVTLPVAAMERLTRLAAALGIASLRAPLFAAAAARAHAALAGRDTVAEDDLRLAAELTLAHRALVTDADPAPADPPPPPDSPPPPDATAPDRPEEDLRLPDEILIEAVRAALPPELLARLAAGRAARAAKGASGSGAVLKGNRRGRPLPARPGRLDGQARIDLVATLRAAAPWQTIRRAATGRSDRLELRPDDIRLKRFQETSDRLLIFAVDASGSSAMARLAEAKGAVELLLAEAYVRRDHVALVAFRGQGAECLLPPTRSLVQTKRRLSGLPGGGGTPLAAGMKAALDLALQTRARGMTPSVALLTDGRGNIALDGRADRGAAETDAQGVARAIRASGIPALVIDTGTRPQPGLSALAGLLDAPYLPLPRADAQRLSSVLTGALGG